jgi:hypothetical protein
VNVIPPVEDTNVIRVADFVRLIGDGIEARMSTAAVSILVPAVDAEPFDALGLLLNIGDVQRDIKATANGTSFTLTGIDTAVLAAVLDAGIKGSSLEMWHGFFDANGNLLTTGGTGGLYQFFNGFVTGYGISESWDDNARQLVATISMSASSSKLILQNRIAGRFTNNNSWAYYTPGDTSMNRVPFIENINYQFGKTA